MLKPLAKQIPPPLELECMKALWLLGEGSARDVREVLTRERALAYTTVMTMLDRLAKKGGLSRRKVGRAFIYSPLLSEEHLRGLAVHDLVQRFFNGSPESLAAYLKGARTDARVAVPEPQESSGRLDTALL